MFLNTEPCEGTRTDSFFLLKINGKKGNFLREVQGYLYHDSSEHLCKA